MEIVDDIRWKLLIGIVLVQLSEHFMDIGLTMAFG